MSFPKAKIHRFNEEMTCAPPPGKYDPKFDNKIKGAVIQKSKRFAEKKLNSASSTESLSDFAPTSCSSFKSSTVNLTPVFRTPQLKKKVITTPKSVSSISLHGSSTGSAKRTLNSEFKNNTLHLEKLTSDLSKELKEKNKEIEELQEELDYMRKNEINERTKIDEERKILEELHHEEIKTLKNDIESLRNKIAEERENHTNEMEKLSDDAVLKIDSIKSDIEEKLKNVEEDLDFSTAEMQINFQKKIDGLCEEIKSQGTELEDRILESIKNVQDMQIGFGMETDKFKDYLKESESKLEAISNNLAGVNVEKEELTVINLEQKLSLIEKDDALMEAETRYKKVDLELSRSKQKCRNFHVATMEHRKTIEALSIRLYESESEVERLNTVQSDLERQKLLLEGKAENLVMEVIGLRESMRSLETEIIHDVEEIKSQLTSKVDTYRIKAAEESKALLETVHEKQRTIDMLLLEIDYYRKRLSETDDFTGSLKEKSEKQNTEIIDLRKKLTDAEEEFTDRLNAQRNVYTILDENYKEKCDVMYKLEQIKYHQEKQIGELMTKLDHQSECAQRSAGQINSLMLKNSENEKRIESLVRKLEASSEYVQTVTNHIENIVEQMNKKEEKMAVMHQDMETKQATLVLISEENSEYKHKIAQQNQHIDDLEKEVRETHKDNEKYVDELISEIVLEKERCSELSTISSQLEEDKFTLENNIKKMMLENEEIATECSSLKEEITNLTQLAQSESEERSRLSRLLSERQEEQRRLQNRMDVENVEKAQLIVELSMKIDNLEELSKKAEDTKGELQKENQMLVEQLSEAKECLKNFESEKLTQEEKLSSLEKQVEELSESLNCKSQEIENLNSHLEVYKSKDVVLHQLNADVAALKHEIIELCDTLDLREKTINDLNESKGNAMQDLGLMEKNILEYEEKVQTLEERHAKEKRDHAELLQAYTKMENRKNEYKLYSSKVTEELDKFKEETKKLRDENERLGKEKKELEITVGPFMKQLKEFEEERSTLASRKDAVEEELLALERMHAKSLGHQNLKQKIHYVSKLKEENIHQKQTIEQLMSENVKLKNKCKDFEIVSRENNSPRSMKNKPIQRVSSPNVLKDRNQQ